MVIQKQIKGWRPGISGKRFLSPLRCDRNDQALVGMDGGRNMINRGWNPRVKEPKGNPTPKWVELKYGNQWLKAMCNRARGNIPG